jgi:phosphohistidine phosphatase
MKKLLLVRHAKATQETGFADFERPLKHRGLQDSEVMASRIYKQNLIPQLLVSSPALRALTTANIFAEHLSLPQPDTDKLIYDATQEALVTVVSGLPDSYDFIGLFGHNPGFSQLLYYFTGEIRDMETCATVLIEFDVEGWSGIGSDSGKITYYSSPEKLV